MTIRTEYNEQLCLCQIEFPGFLHRNSTTLLSSQLWVPRCGCHNHSNHFILPGSTGQCLHWQSKEVSSSLPGCAIITDAQLQKMPQEGCLEHTVSDMTPLQHARGGRELDKPTGRALQMKADLLHAILFRWSINYYFLHISCWGLPSFGFF